MSKFVEHAKIIAKAEKVGETYILDTAQNHGDSVFRLMLVSAKSPTVLCTYNFVLKYFLFIDIYLTAGQGSG